MIELYTIITDSVSSALIRAGEQLSDYNVHAMVSSTQVLHGQIIRDYRALVYDGYTARGAYMILATRYGMTPGSIRQIVIHSRKIVKEHG